MKKKMLVTNSLERQVCIVDYVVNWLKKTFSNKQDITASFNNAVTVVFWEEPLKIYDSKGVMFEVTCKKSEPPLFKCKEKLKMYWV